MNRPLALGLGLGTALLVMSTPAFSQATPMPCLETLTPAPAAALAPTDVQLAITVPLAGTRLVATAPGKSITVTADYLGPALVPPDTAHAVDDYHLAYLLDENESRYLGTLSPIPHCSPHIVHSASTAVTFDGVQAGSHVLSVVLTGSNDVAVNPPIATSVTFLVKS